MAETKRQMVSKFSGKVIETPAEKRAGAVTALVASGKAIKTVEDAKVVLSEINRTDSDSIAARWYREYSRNESQLKTLLREYRSSK
jgi:hypothetical protein